MEVNGTILTKEERDVLILVGTHPDGRHLSNSEIGQRLGISVNRVKMLIHQACIKLKAHNRNEALLFSIRRGEIKLNDYFTLDEMADMMSVLRPVVLRRITHIIREGLEYEHLEWKDEHIIHKNIERDAILAKSEKAVLILVGRGLTNREIADTMCISVNTVKSFLYRACTKLRASKRNDAVVLALKRGDIGISDIYSLSEVIDNLVPMGAEYTEKITRMLSQKLGQEPVPASS